MNQPKVMAAGAGQAPVESGHSGHLLAIPDEISMVRRATEVLGLGHVATWMHSRIPSLGNQTPYALLSTQEGRQQVERVLLKIENGVY